MDNDDADLTLSLQISLDETLKAQYEAYYSSMMGHGCECLALTFDQWRSQQHRATAS